MGIDEILLQIITARYGRDVRQAIHDGIKQAYEDAIKNGNANMEVSQARGSYPTLGERLTQEFQKLIQTDEKNMNELTDLIADKINRGEAEISDFSQSAREYLANVAENGFPVVGPNSTGTINLIDKSVTSPKLANGAVKWEHMHMDENLFDKSIAKSGYYLTDGTLKADSKFVHVKVPLKPNTYYYTSTQVNPAGAIFNSEGVRIAGIAANPFLTADTASYAYINAMVADGTWGLSTFMVSTKPLPNYYVPFGSGITWLDNYIASKNAVTSKKKIKLFGTSISWYGDHVFGNAHIEAGLPVYNHVDALRDYGYIVDNLAISGGKWAGNILQAVQNTDLTDADCVIFNGGVNDWASQVPRGTVGKLAGTFDTTTLAGALQTAIESVIARNKKTKILLVKPIKAKFKVSSTDPLAGQEMPNSYLDVYDELAKLYGLPLLDLYDSTGVNNLTYDSLYGDIGVLGDRYVHPTQLHYDKINPQYVDFVKRNV